MPENYIPLKEAATLEEIEYHTFYRKIQRNTANYKIKKTQPDYGGNELILVALSSLSYKARKAYRAQNKILILDLSSSSDENVTPWYITIDLHWYTTNHKKHYYKAVELSKRISGFLEDSIDIPHGEKGKLSSKMAKMLNISKRSFDRNVEDYLKAGAWAEKMFKETGKNHDYFKVLALAREPREKNTFSSLTDEMKVLLENIRFDDLVARNQWKIAKIYRLFVEKALEMGWASDESELPDYQTINRYIKYIVQGHSGAAYLAATNTKEWERKFMEKHRRDLASLMVMEVVMGDGHTFDCWVMIRRANGTVDYIRPHILGWIDLKTRCLVGWVICEVPDSQVTKKSILNMIYEKKDSQLPYGVPKYLYIDNGKEYTAQCLLGRPRTERASLDSEAKGFIRGIGIEDDIRAIPYRSSSKAEIERLFGTICEDFSKESNTYIGTLTGSKTSAKIQRDIKKMGEKGLVESIEAFAKRFQAWVKKYHSRNHSGLKEQGEKVASPIGLFNSAERYFKPAPPITYSEMLLMKPVSRIVRQEGIKMFGNMYFTHELLRKYRNQKVLVRYNPDDVSDLHVYDAEGKKICIAESYELLKISPKSNENALVKHLKSQAAERNDTRDELRYLRSSMEQRIDLSEGRKALTPETVHKDPRVVSIPDDQQFKDDVMDKKSKEKDTLPDFYIQQAEKFFKRVKNL